MGIKNKLENHGIKEKEGALTTFVPSRFNEKYYKTFKTTLVLPSSFKLPIQIDFNDSEIPNGKQEFYLLDYKSNTDFLVVNQKLSEFEKNILTFIGLFRYVQKYQIIKEFGLDIPGKLLKEALNNLHNLFLIDVRRFERSEGGEAECYSINRNGTYFLTYFSLLSKEDAFHWGDEFEANDNLQPIRCWKIVDAYQVMKMSSFFKSYNAQKYFLPKPYTVSKGNKKSRKKIYLRKFKVDGELVFENSQFEYYFDLYPVCNDLDIANLFYGLQHWATMIEEQRYLLIIVDSWSMIEKINEHYNLADYEGNLVFLDLEQVQNEDMLSCLYQYDREQGEMAIMKFKLKESLLEKEEK